MQYTDNPTLPMQGKTNKGAGHADAPTVTVDAVLSLLGNIVETSCEHESALDTVRLINLMDMYRVYIQEASNPQSDQYDYLQTLKPSDSVLTQKLGGTELVSFERFVRDSRLLNVAARAASRESGETVQPPAPLMISANG